MSPAAKGARCGPDLSSGARPTPGIRLATDTAVTLRVEGQPRALPQSLELAVYRVVQEALTNVVRHAVPPVTATVVICYDEDGAVVVEVTDDGRGTGNKRRSGGGHGLAGMRERVCLLGGELSAGPRAGGGYRVLARLPSEAGPR